ncbi:hypothetical protein Q2T40_12450 [Winogradskyella maritima]|uniref:DUF6630 domain-containing protein n=1 Tax=Winogradskyella maritima TaxID=1517766 RepID=A0ABV8AIG5_9FLAO|nr:hypothetical protein [Winogradskyella maritima]
MNIVRTFIHTNKDIHGNCVSEFLLPNIAENKPNFIGMTSGKSYDKGLIVGTSRKWDENILFNEFKKVKSVGLFGRKRKKQILKNYIAQIPKIGEEHPDSIVKLDYDLSLVRVESRTEFLNRTKPKPKSISKKIKESYLNLSQACLNEEHLSEFQSFVKTLKDYNGHWKYGTTLNFVHEFLNQKKIFFFLVLDWKAGISDLNWILNLAFEKNFKEKVELPSPDDYPERASVSYDNVFCDYKKVLNKLNFDITILDTDSDQYVLLLHKLSEKDNISESITGIEFKKMKINCT